MPPLQLANSTNTPEVDAVLAGTIGIFFTCFPDRIRAAYITGSYAFGTAREDSDLDLFFVFKEPLQGPDYKKVNQLRDYCQQLTPLSLDYKACDEPSLLRSGMPMLEKGSLFLYGEDIKEALPDEPVGFQYWAMHTPFALLSRARRNPPYLKYPIQSPKPEEPLGGYDSRKGRLPDGTYVPTTKMLYTNCLAIGMALIGERCGTFTFKPDLAIRYREVMGDEWSDYIDEIYRVTVQEQVYAIPQEPAARERLVGQCKRMLDFENHFLDVYRQYLLKEISETGRESIWSPLPVLSAPLGMHPKAMLALLTPDRYERKTERGEDLVRIRDVHRAFAVAMFSRVIYPQPEVLDTLKALLDDPDPLLQQVVPPTIRTIEEALS